MPNHDHVAELIMRICYSVSGIGAATAGAVATDFEDDLQGFLNADSERLSQIKNSRQKLVLSENSINNLILEKSVIIKGRSPQETWVFYLGREFLKGQVQTVRDISFGDIDINPLLAKALDLNTPRKIIAFNVYQTITRSVVTSWGIAVENMVKYVGICEPNTYKVEGKTGTNFDLVKALNGTDYYIQIKSGPNTMNVGMVTSLNETIKLLEAEKENAKGILGMTYGIRARISKQILGNLQEPSERMKIGRELWDFVSEKSNFHETVFQLLDLSSQGILEQSFIDLIEAKISSFEKQWEERFAGKTVTEVLDKYI